MGWVCQMQTITYFGGVLVLSSHCSILNKTILYGEACWDNYQNITPVVQLIQNSTNPKFLALWIRVIRYLFGLIAPLSNCNILIKTNLYGEAGWDKWSEHSSNGFNQLKILLPQAPPKDKWKQNVKFWVHQTHIIRYLEGPLAPSTHFSILIDTTLYSETDLENNLSIVPMGST
jgi:hypothetical protein